MNELQIKEDNMDYVLNHMEEKFHNLCNEIDRYKKGDLPISFVYELMKKYMTTGQGLVNRIEGE